MGEQRCSRRATTGGVLAASSDDMARKDETKKNQVFGIAAITQAFKDLEFPATKEELLRKAGSHTVEYRKGQPVQLRPILDDLDDEEFSTMDDVVAAVSDALEEEGDGVSRSDEEEEEARTTD
jgi:hypothetical protein